MRFVALLIGLAAAAPAQSISITSPSNNQTLAGALFTFSSACSSCPTLYAMEYDVDGEVAGITRTAPYALGWNTFYASNGQHTVSAIARDALNNVLATSSAVAFSVENDLPQNLPGTNCGSGGSAPACTDLSVVTGPVASFTYTGGAAWAQVSLALKTTGVAVVTPFSTPASSAYVGTSFALASAADTAGSALAVYVSWGISTTSITVTDSEGNTYSCDSSPYSPNPSTSYTSQWCIAPNITGSAGNVVTVHYSASQSSHTTTVQAVQITNVAHTSPVDVPSQGTSGSGGAPLNSPTLAVTQTRDVILSGAAVAGVTTITPEAGYSSQSTSTTATAWYVAPSSGWYTDFGVTATVNGPKATTSKTITLFVDGYPAASSGNTGNATNQAILTTTNYLNAAHQVLIRADIGNCPGCANGIWSDAGAWEQTITFSNPVLPAYLTASAREVMLCTTAASNCPASYTITGTDVNTNGSTSAATISSCVPDPLMGTGNYPIVFTVSGTCTVTQATGGMDFLTMTDSNGFTRKVWVLVQGVNQLPHFGVDGRFYMTYTAGKSIFLVSPFFSCSPFQPQASGVSGGVNQAAIFGPAFAAMGINTCEYSLDSPGNGTSQTNFQNTVNTAISTISSNLTNYGQGVLKYVHGIGDPYYHGTPELFQSVYGAGGLGSYNNSSLFSTPAWQYAIQQWAASGILIGITGKDEVGLSWGGNPLEGTNTGGIMIGTNGITSITGNGTTCTINGWGSPLNSAFTGSNNFIITGSGQSALDYNTATNANLFHATTSNTNVTFPCTFTGTTTASTAQINPYVNNTFNASGAACASGGSNGPCTLWVQNNALMQMRIWQTNVTNYPKITFPLQNGCCTFGIANWSGATQVGGVAIADYWEPYWTGGTTVYLPGTASLNDLIGNFGDTLRTSWNWMNRATPMVAETASTNVDYNVQGYPVPVSSCSGQTCTLSVPHGIYNVIPEMTKLWIQGSSSADGNYYVIASPTATTVTLALANPTVGTVGGNAGGTILFRDGSTFTAGGFSVPGSNTNGYANFGTSTGGCSIKNKRGQTFTVSGNSNPAINSMAGGWYDSGATYDSCSSLNWWRQLPNLSSTGGMAFIVPDLWYRRGISWQTNSEISPMYEAASVNECAIEGCSGHRPYSGLQGDPQYFDRTAIGQNDPFPSHLNWLFNPTAFADVQASFNPVTDFAKSQLAAVGITFPNLLHERLIKYEFQPRLNSPDYGPFFEAAARTGTFGNLLMIQSMADNTISCTANLAPYLVTGQPIIRISATWSAIEPIVILPAGTASDTMTCRPGEFRAYIFAKNFAAELEQPAIAARLADISNAAKVVVQFSYAPLAFASASVASQMLYQTIDCGSGACTLPVDRQIGTVYYRLLSLNSAGAVIATSDVQTF